MDRTLSERHREQIELCREVERGLAALRRTEEAVARGRGLPAVPDDEDEAD
jgi:hypothetical protein